MAQRLRCALVLEGFLKTFGIALLSLISVGSGLAAHLPRLSHSFPVDREKAFAGMPHRQVSEIVPNQIRIKFMPRVAEQIAFARPVGDMPHTVLFGGATQISDLTFLSRIAKTGWTLWSVPPKTNLQNLVASLRKEEGVVY